MSPIVIGLLATGALLLLSKTARGQVPYTKVGGFTDAFDPVYQAGCPGIPVYYLRALAKYESDSNPQSCNSGEGCGLLQVVESVRREYNEKNRTNYTRGDLLDPWINARIACSLLTRIKTYYATAYRRAFPRPTWGDRRFVEVVTLAWNVGWSERGGGVGYVISVLLGEGHTTDIDVDLIRQRAAGLPEAAPKLREALPVVFSRRVTSAYFTIAGQA